MERKIVTRREAKKLVEHYLGVYDKRTLTEQEKGILVTAENMAQELLELIANDCTHKGKENVEDIIRRYAGTHILIDVTGIGLSVAHRLESAGIKLERVQPYKMVGYYKILNILEDL